MQAYEVLWISSARRTTSNFVAGPRFLDNTFSDPRVREWDAFLAGFWFGAPTSIENANVKGLKWGLPISSGKGQVIGFEWSFFCGATDTVKSLQWAMIGVNYSQDVSGMQMALVNVVEKTIDGDQFGIVNACINKGVQIGIVNTADNADCQIGLVNLNKNGWMPFMVFINHSK